MPRLPLPGWIAGAALLAACASTADDPSTPLGVDAAVSAMAARFAQADLTGWTPGRFTADETPALPTVGVLGFTLPEGSSELGERIAYELSVALAEALRAPPVPHLQVITRYHLDDLLREQGLSLLDPFAPADVPHVGRLLHADYLVIGMLAPARDVVHVTAQMLGVADGVLVGGWRGTLRADRDVLAQLRRVPARPALAWTSSRAAGRPDPAFTSGAAASRPVPVTAPARGTPSPPTAGAGTAAAAATGPTLVARASNDSVLVDGAGRPTTGLALLLQVRDAVGPHELRVVPTPGVRVQVDDAWTERPGLVVADLGVLRPGTDARRILDLSPARELTPHALVELARVELVRLDGPPLVVQSLSVLATATTDPARHAWGDDPAVAAAARDL